MKEQTDGLMRAEKFAIINALLDIDTILGFFRMLSMAGVFLIVTALHTARHYRKEYIDNVVFILCKLCPACWTFIIYPAFYRAQCNQSSPSASILQAILTGSSRLNMPLLSCHLSGGRR